MATKNELAEDYKNRIKTELKRSPMLKTEAVIKDSAERDRIVNLLKGIWKDLNKYEEDGQPLKESTKEEILTLAGKKLGLKPPRKLYVMIKESSNDNFMALMNYWADFFSEVEL